MTEEQNNLHLETIERKYNFQLEAADIFNRLVQIPELVLELNGLLQDFNSHNHDMHNDVRYQPLGDYAALVHGHSMSEIQETVDKKVMTATERDVLSTLGTTYAKADLSNVITKSLGLNGYYKFPDGLLMQWGYSNSSGVSTRINFPISFYNDNYSITMGVNGGIGTITSLSIIITERASTYIKVKGTMGDSSSTHDNSFYWIAIGRWK